MTMQFTMQPEMNLTFLKELNLAKSKIIPSMDINHPLIAKIVLSTDIAHPLKVKYISGNFIHQRIKLCHSSTDINYLIR